MYVYNQLKSNPEFKANYYPHTFIFGAKSAPGYAFAKKIIKLINTIADKVNNDYETNYLLKVVFVVNYNVTYAETIIPPSNVPHVIAPFIMNFIFEVPEASFEAVEICSDTLAAGIIVSA